METGSEALAQAGSKKRVEIPPSPDMKRVVLGPFKRGDVPRLTIRRQNVDPPGSLICHTARVDEGNHYKLVYNFQNYGMKTVVVTIRRSG